MESLPEYSVYRSKRKSIRIVLRQNGTFAVYCPKRCPVKDIEAALSRHHKQMRDKFNLRADILFAPDNGEGSLPLLGKRYPLTYGTVKKLVFDGERFISPTADREEVRLQYRELLRKKAKEILPAMASETAEKFGLTFCGISVKAIYSRYGSCSSKKHLNFSLALAAFNEEFIRFVVCHELCHTAHMDHSASFYAMLDRLCPDHRRIKSEGGAERSAILKGIHFSPA